MPENSGALVAAVTPESPAAKAGMQSGDVILKFDGKDVVDACAACRGSSRRAPIGKKVDVEILRKGQKKTLQVTVGRLRRTRTSRPISRRQSEAGRLGSGRAGPEAVGADG